jgi:hydroxyacid-oxoacid transhydrogenase
VHCSSGLDVLCHALESYTAIPFNERVPRPTNPILRPAYQGANPISDVFSLQALKATIKYLPRAVRDPNDSEAQSQMMLAATLAGVGFGNAGVHLCHGLSYGISGNNRGFQQKGYDIDHPLIPHGISVAVTAPAVFAFTAASNPERHLEVAQLFGADITNARAEDAGAILSEAIMRFLAELGIPPRGLKPLGFGRSDIEELVQATLPQRRVLMLAPNYDEEIDRQREVLSGILEESLTY